MHLHVVKIFDMQKNCLFVVDCKRFVGLRNKYRSNWRTLMEGFLVTPRVEVRVGATEVQESPSEVGEVVQMNLHTSAPGTLNMYCEYWILTRF